MKTAAIHLILWMMLLFATMLPNSAAAADRVLVFLVFGTWGGEGHWPRVIEGKATFASEMRRALPAGAEVYPLMWDAPNLHANRTDAAVALAELIDARAGEFDRICLVGHSHGGNVCLVAAGLCATKIDSVVCLSTPHYYLKTKYEDGTSLNLPVYCSPRALANASHIVSVTPRDDMVAKVFANVMKGIGQDEAIYNTKQWQEEANYPRLYVDHPIARFFKIGNVEGSNLLGVTGVENFFMHSLSTDPLGIQPHHYVHSRRMGYLVGRTLRDHCAPEDLLYLQSYIQPADSDAGEPVPQNQHYAHLRANLENMRFSGWVLEQLKVNLTEAAITAADDGHEDGTPPDPFIHLTGSTIRPFRTFPRKDSMELSDVFPGLFLRTGQDVTLSILDRDWFSSLPLGSFTFPIDQSLPQTIESEFWSAELTWQWVHD